MIVKAPSLGAALAAAEQANRAAGYPRCIHPKWRSLPDPPGRSRPCPCVAEDDPDPDCPHVTWQSVAVLELAGGTVVLEGDADVLAAVPAVRGWSHRPVTDEEKHGATQRWDQREDRRAVHAAPASPGRSTRA